MSLLHVIYQGRFLYKEFMTVNTLKSRSVFVRGTLRVTFCNVLLKIFRKIKAFFALTAFLSVFHFPVLHPGSGLGAIFVPLMNLHVSVQ